MNKRFFIFLILLLLYIVSISCFRIEYYENGLIKGEGRKIFQKKMGFWKTYYDNDKKIVFQSGRFINDKEIGLWNTYFENSNLKQSGFFKGGKQHGHWYFYYPNETLKGEGALKFGNRDGIWTWYHANGVVFTKRHWDNGKLLNVLICSDSLANELDKGTIYNGNGTLKIYESNGDLIDVIEYKNGVIDE
jgi:antitoxin component YwqK of YwqJK toxin-antitoxin module